MSKDRNLMAGEYGTHMPALLTAVMNTDGPILEMGCGDFSTTLLHAICTRTKRKIVSVDTDRKWLDLFTDLEKEWHQFIYLPVYDDDWLANPKPYLWDAIGNNEHWSVVLIDHRPGERRIEDIERLRAHVDVFVVHDTERWTYNYESVLATFKYRYVYDRYKQHTTLVSDTMDVAQFFQ